MVQTALIPAWVVAVFMIITGIMWLLTIHSRIRMDSRIFAYTFILEGLVYGIIYQFFPVHYEVRGFLTRLMILVLCISQSLPLAISYFRSRHR